MAANYRDSTAIDQPDTIDQNKVSDESKLIAKWLREKMYGVDVREALARLAEQTSSDVYDDRVVALALQALVDKLTKEWQDTLAGATQDSEVKNARTDVNGLVYTTLKLRIDALQLSTATMLYVTDVQEIQTLRLLNLTQTSSPMRYAKVATVEDVFTGDPGLKIQDVSKIRIVKVSDI